MRDLLQRGIGAIAPWRRELAGENLADIARQLTANSMAVSGFCRSTYYTAPTLSERKLAIDDNRRALDDAATLNAACYMQVVGGLARGSKDLYEAREQVKYGIRQLLPPSRDVGVPIALEPLHPMTAAAGLVRRTRSRWRIRPGRSGGRLPYLVGPGPRESDPAGGKAHSGLSHLRLAGADHRSSQRPGYAGRRHH